MATLDEGLIGSSLQKAPDFTFEKQANDGSLGSGLVVIAFFTGVRCGRQGSTSMTQTGGAAVVSMMAIASGWQLT